MEHAASLLSTWESFYVIVGSSAAALTGLQFVMIALVADSPMKTTNRELSAFATPTVIHFSVVLLVSAMLSAPWHGLAGPAVILGLCGVPGVAYILYVVRRTRQQSGYRPVLEDWIWHACFPFLAYGALLVSALTLSAHPIPVLFVVAAAALLLMFIGIHNAWDTVTYVAIRKGEADASPEA